MLKRTSILGLLSLLIALILTTVLFSDGLPFRDVPPGAWYFNDVKTAFDTGLINGKSDTQFAPDDNMTAAEAVKLAACMHQLKNTGALSLASDGKPWYKAYVDYAKENNIIAEDLPWNENINRAGYMQIFAQLITDAEAGLNDVPDDSIPDVRMSYPNAEAIYKLYRAGVVQGVNAERYSNLYSYIKRSEVAAILTRMMNVDKRIKLSPPTEPGEAEIPEELKITKEPQDAKAILGTRVDLTCEVTGGKKPITYLWQYYDEGTSSFKNSTSEGNRTNRLKAPVEDEAHEYRCVIEDVTGKVLITKNVKVEKIEEGPLSIAKEPEGFEGNIGDIAHLKVEVTGGKKPYTYQWHYLEPGIEGSHKSRAEGNQTKELKVAVEEKIYIYCCVIKDGAGAEVKTQFVKVKEAGSADFRIAIQPVGYTGELGDPVYLDVGDNGGGRLPLEYRWEYNEYGTKDFHSSNYPGSKTYSLSAKVEEKIYDYRCVLTDADGKRLISDTVRVGKTSDYSDFKITKQPEHKKGKVGEEVELVVEIMGGKAPLTYSWDYLDFGLSTFKSSRALGYNTNKLRVKIEDATYDYRCLIFDADGRLLVSKLVRVEKR